MTSVAQQHLYSCIIGRWKLALRKGRALSLAFTVNLFYNVLELRDI